MISYATAPNKIDIQVKLDGRVVGAIRRDSGGWYYQPKGSKAKGEQFHALADVKHSIEGKTNG